MDGYSPSTYGDRIAAVYDEFYSPRYVTERVDVLEELAGGGCALELGIGTGTYSLPLAGLRLRNRRADWSKSTFTSESRSHVSVYERMDSSQ